MSGTFEVRVEAAFRAYHRRGPDGEECGRHPHDWSVAVHARSRRLDAIAIVVDFRRLRDDTEALLQPLGDGDLEDHPELGAEPTTALRVARWILGRLRAGAEGEPWEISAVEVEADRGIRYVAEAVRP